MFLFPPRVCTVTEDQTKTVSGAHSPRFVFRFEKFLFCSSVYVCLSRGMEVAARHSRHSPLQVGVGVRRVHWPRALMPADRGRYPSPAVALPSPPASLSSCRSPRRAVRGRSRHRIASDSMPAGPPLTQCPPAHRCPKARRIASDSMPAGPPLNQCPPARRCPKARRIAADSSPPDCRWLKPTGSALIHPRWPPLSLVPWIKSTCYGQECRVCFVVPTGTF